MNTNASYVAQCIEATEFFYGHNLFKLVPWPELLISSPFNGIFNIYILKCVKNIASIK